MSRRKQSVRSNRVCFTLNNPNEIEKEGIKKCLEDRFARNLLQFAIVGEEVGEVKNTPHLQGFIHYKTSFLKATSGNVSFWKSQNGMARAHFESARGTDEDSREYCSKEGKIFLELGAPSAGTCRWGAIREMDSMKQVLEEYPEEGFRAYFAIKHFMESKGEIKMDAPSQLMPWQLDCLDRVVRQNDRQILFVVDTQGNTGKSILARWMIANWGAFANQGGKTGDLVCARSRMPQAQVNVFDLARNKDPKFWPMDFMESLKNGWMCNTKYESKMLVLPPAQKVVVFCNQEPSYDALSADRYDILNLDSTTVSTDDVRSVPLNVINAFVK